MIKILIIVSLFTSLTMASYDKLAKLAGISSYKMNKIVKKMIKVETLSGKYTVQNPRSGAYGRYQIMPQTAARYAKKLSISFESWKEPKNQDKIFKAIMKDNILGLKKNKYPISSFSLYGTHQQGVRGFLKIIHNKRLTKSIERNMRHNLPKKYEKVNVKVLRLVWMMYWKKKLLRTI